MTGVGQFVVGQRVRALVACDDDLREDGMGLQRCADKGDVLVVRAIHPERKIHPLSVSHVSVTDRTFGCAPNEVEPI